MMTCRHLGWMRGVISRSVISSFSTNARSPVAQGGHAAFALSTWWVIASRQRPAYVQRFGRRSQARRRCGQLGGASAWG
jgi:hypothetical protein